MTIEVRVSRDTSTMKLGDWLRLGRYALRRRLLIAVTAATCLVAASAVALVKKSIYEASTEIIVRPQNIPKDFIKPTVNQDLSKVVKTLSQQIMSRSRLQKIIEEFDLYPEIRRTEGSLEAIEAMRRSIIVESWSADSFKIIYRGTDPIVVRDVANTLASLFIQENLRSREQEAQTITEYLEKELARAQQELEQTEAEIRRFQEENMGALPSQEQAIANTLGNLISQYQTLSEQIRSAQNRKLILSGQMRDAAREASMGRSTDDSVYVPARIELARARKRLETLQRAFTEDHPQVISAKELVRQLEVKARAEKRNPPPAEAVNPSESLLAEMHSTDREIQALSAERTTVQKRMGQYEAMMSKIPKVAEQFASLRRKYEFAQSTYNDLRTKADEARRSQQMEERQKGEQFEIVDKAVIPAQPRHPRKHELVLAGLIAGLGLGFALSFARTFFDPTFRARSDLAAAVPLPVLSSIPKLEEG